MATRKICESCGENFGKSSYYAHLPCEYCKLSKSVSSYKLCNHCNKWVAKTTYYDHQNKVDQNQKSSRQFSQDVVECVPENTCSQDESTYVECISDDEEEGVDAVGFDDEDETFFSDLEEDASSTDDEITNVDNDGREDYSDNGREDTDCSNEEFEYCDDNIEEKSDEGQDETVFKESRGFILFILLWQTLYKVSDRGIVVLLRFLRSFIAMIGKLTQMDILTQFARCLPVTLYMAKSYLGLGTDEFEKYVVCPKCMTLYDIDKCTSKKTNGRVVSNRCTHISFPNHPQKSKRRQCGAFLMKRMRSKSGSLFLHPKKLYCFRKLTDSLTSLLSKPGILESCESWRERNNQQSNSMTDSFDGKIWREFKDVNGEAYFATPGNMGVMLNVDWFQPYKHTQYSLGVLYLVLMNLPRSERFKPENVIIVGMIPGPNEPKGHINTFLQPLVDDLIELWDGVILKNKHCLGGMFKVRAALLALSCDIPAARKCGGFAGHSARKGCSKCFKTFPCASFGSKPDFSGFNVEDWEKRTSDLHKLHAESIQMATCEAQVKKIVRETGAKYSVLFELPYYDAVRFTVIDPMHNLFLGLAKRTLKLWINKELLSDKQLQLIQKRVNAVNPPSEIGRIPTKIASGFGGFTADQWKNWVCYYSVFALKNILPEEDYNAWLHLVTACRIICRKVISMTQCSQAEREIVEFCKQCEHLYGTECCTPNMHLSCHLVDCIRDYGPVYSFWCFSFERYNGILGSYHKNNHNIEIQLMRKFLRDIQLQNLEFPSDNNDFKELLVDMKNGTIGETIKDLQSDEITPCPPIKRIALDKEDSLDLHMMYKSLYPQGKLDCLRLCDSFTRLTVSGILYQSLNNVGVIAKWFNGEVRPGRVCRFLNHHVVMKEQNGKRKKVSHVLAEVKWFKKHPEQNFYPKPFEVWSTEKEHYSDLSYIPVKRFMQKCIIVNYKVRFSYGTEKVNVIIPMISHLKML